MRHLLLSIVTLFVFGLSPARAEIITINASGAGLCYQDFCNNIERTRILDVGAGGYDFMRNWFNFELQGFSDRTVTGATVSIWSWGMPAVSSGDTAPASDPYNLYLLDIWTSEQVEYSLIDPDYGTYVGSAPDSEINSTKSRYINFTLTGAALARLAYDIVYNETAVFGGTFEGHHSVFSGTGWPRPQLTLTLAPIASSPTPVSVPEPATLGLLGIGALGLLVRRRKA